MQYMFPKPNAVDVDARILHVPLADRQCHCDLAWGRKSILLLLQALTGGQLKLILLPARQRCSTQVSSSSSMLGMCDSDRSSFERCNSGQGIDTEDEFRGEYAEPKQGHTKDFLRQRRMDIRSSLDWDFDSHRPILVTRRSKDYGEESQRVLASSVDQGRS